MPTGETVTVRKLQDTLNRCDVLADAFIKQSEEVKAKDRQIAALTAENTNLREQIAQYELVTVNYQKSVEALTAALEASKDGSAARDVEIKLLKERVEKLSKHKTSLFQKILMVVAGIGIGSLL